jgi:tetratricopeptide (TPR) repeat protein
LSHLYNGNLEKAQACREKIELLQLDGLDPLVIPNMQTGIYMEARAHVLVGSLPELRDAIDVIAGLADSIPSWLPVLCWARGEYHKLREDYAGATVELERALSHVPSGRHLVWPWVMAALAECVLASGDAARAYELATSALQRCAELPIQLVTRVDLERVAALAEAQLGETTRAARRLDAAIASVQHEAGGVPLGRLYEARAQVALLGADASSFRKHVRLTDEQYRQGAHPALIARCEKLIEQGLQHGIDAKPRSGRSTAKVSKATATDAIVRALDRALKDCDSVALRAQRALRVLMEVSGAKTGYVLVPGTTALRLIAAAPEREPVPELVSYLQRLVDDELDETTIVATAQPPLHTADGRFVLASGDTFFPSLLLVQRETGLVTVGVVALELASSSTQLSKRVYDVLAEHLSEPEPSVVRVATR